MNFLGFPEKTRDKREYGVIDNELIVKYYNSESKKTYNTTKLVIEKKPKVIDGKEVYPCRVYWYNGGTSLNSEERQKEDEINCCYRSYDEEILAQIDLNLLNENRYLKKVMEELLDKNRIEGYIAKGLTETPDEPCGNYVGGIFKSKGEYTVGFDREVGEIVHNSYKMRQMRWRNSSIQSGQKTPIAPAEVPEGVPEGVEH